MIRLNEQSALRQYEPTGERHIRVVKDSDRISAPRKELDIPEFVQKSGSKYNHHGDSFETRRTSSRTHGRSRKNKNNGIKKTAAGVLASLMIVGGGIKACNSAKPPELNYNANQTVVEISEQTNIDARAILLANNLDDENQLVESIVLPEIYNSPLEDEISEIKEKLDSGKLSTEKKQKLMSELQILQHKLERQESLATVYADKDEKYVYIIPNEYGTSTEDIKEAFGIKDGVIRKYNGDKLTFTWETDDPEYGYYKDYTQATTPMSGIKIPFNEINKMH